MRLGPRRRITAEELVRPRGGGTADLFEVLSCGHRQPVQVDGDGDYTARERCCKGCRDGLRPGPPGRVLQRTELT